MLMYKQSSIPGNDRKMLPKEKIMAAEVIALEKFLCLVSHPASTFLPLVREREELHIPSFQMFRITNKSMARYG